MNAFTRAVGAAALATALAMSAHASGFDIADTQGRHHRLGDAKGRWVVVNFWATWCVPCIQEIPEIAAFARDHRDVEVIGVAVDAKDADKVRAFAKKVGHDYPLVLSDESVERQLGEPKALPTTRIYDPSGRLVYVKPSRVDRKLLESFTQRART